MQNEEEPGAAQLQKYARKSNSTRRKDRDFAYREGVESGFIQNNQVEIFKVSTAALSNDMNNGNFITFLDQRHVCIGLLS
jgi:hypothetical protein